MPPSSEAPDAGGFRQAGRLLLRRRLRSGGRASLLVLLSLAAAAAFEAPLSPLRSRLHSLEPTEVQTTRASGPGPRRGGWCDGADDEQRCWNEPDTGRRASRQQGGISSEGSLLPPEAPGASPFPRVDDDSFAVDPPIPFGATRQQRREEPTAGVGGRSARAEASEERAAPAEQRLPEAGLDPETSTWPGEDQGSPQRRLREKRHGDRQRRPEGEDGEGGVVRYKDVSSHGQPYTVKVDGRFVRVGGRKTLLIAAGMPAYVFYSEGSDWPNFLRSARAAGCNAVHTAVVWAAHEQTPDVYDFIRPSANLVKFAQLAAANDLFLILDIWPAPEARPHWKNGGLPAWLDVSVPRFAMSDEGLVRLSSLAAVPQ
ncbi:glycosyl hydrolases family 35 protein [Besnoitia besnoiti]|uniref:Glycosyl hydrolases family 35 protein n=1 Tax=Besnoitia besnoiti TaxID=94643 RepID=A0A2A9MJI9_BESBE|nr:glycosyl hydrolases family 35 protein [Besnoitia besnoiti]PFH36136.1 glycosyl hydrolases family 35 protein [Besnoitia besnoiti]